LSGPGPQLGGIPPGPGPMFGGIGPFNETGGQQGPGVDEPEFPAGLPTRCDPDEGPQGTSCGGPLPGGPGDGPGNDDPGNPPGVPGPPGRVGVPGPGGVVKLFCPGPGPRGPSGPL
jgi:hypothetical protein